MDQDPHRPPVQRAEYSSARTQRWTVHVRRADTGETQAFTCAFLFCCGGYYRYDDGLYAGLRRASSASPARWSIPSTGPRTSTTPASASLVIGSGATAVTLVPALAETAAHVTMLQRSPTYVVSLPSRDGVAEWLRRRLPRMAAYHLVRGQERGADDALLPAQPPPPQPHEVDHPPGRAAASCPTATTSTRTSSPITTPGTSACASSPTAICSPRSAPGRASIVTDQVQTFTERGVSLRGGAELEADVIVTATGLQMLALGGIGLAVDGEPVHLPDQVVYKGMMLSGVPNFAFTVGYTNASWTLKADLTAVLRLPPAQPHAPPRLRRSACPPTRTRRLIREPLLNLNSGLRAALGAGLPHPGLQAAVASAPELCPGRA